MPAIVAASSSVSSFAGFPKYSCDAASTPNARFPHATLLQYIVRISCFVVPLFDLERDQRLFDLANAPGRADALEADGFGKQLPRELLRDRAAARRPAP